MHVLDSHTAIIKTLVLRGGVKDPRHINPRAFHRALLCNATSASIEGCFGNGLFPIVYVYRVSRIPCPYKLVVVITQAARGKSDIVSYWKGY